jgi:hypothetical protein
LLFLRLLRAHTTVVTSIYVSNILDTARKAATPDHGVVVHAGMPRELIGPAEAFLATTVRAGMWLLAGVSTDMPGLVFETVKGFVA